MNWLLALILGFTAFISAATQPHIEFSNVTNNVSYSKVAALAHSPADEKIAYGTESLQYALFWRAKQSGTTKLRPLIILIHGGCWLSAYDIQHTYALSTGLAQAGFNVWSLEYRRSGDVGGGWPGSYDDIKVGILASADYNRGEFDLSNAIVVGHSAGGHLALLAGGALPNLQGVIGLAPITDIEEYALGSNSCQQVTKDFMQGKPSDKPQAYRLANPSKQPLHINSIILQGSEDQIVPAFELDKLERTVIMLEGVGHFDWIHPGSTAFNTLIEQLNGLAP